MSGFAFFGRAFLTVALHLVAGRCQTRHTLESLCMRTPLRTLPAPSPRPFLRNSLDARQDSSHVAVAVEARVSPVALSGFYRMLYDDHHCQKVQLVPLLRVIGLRAAS